MHTVLITIHAAGGVVALLSGTRALFRARWFALYEAALVLALAALAGAVVLDWPGLSAGARGLYVAFLALAAVLIAQAERARRARSSREGVRATRYVSALGFTLVALLDAFVVIAVLDAGGAAWLLVVVGVLIALAGHLALRYRLRFQHGCQGGHGCGDPSDRGPERFRQDDAGQAPCRHSPGRAVQPR